MNFEKFAEKYQEPLKLHEDPGHLWDKDEQGRDWRNVTEHCLLEAARAEVFSEKLKFTTELAQDLATAAALHDFYKKIDIQYTREDLAAGGSGDAGNLRSEAEAAEYLRRAGYNERVITMIKGVGGDPGKLLLIKKLFDEGQPSDDNIAEMVLHYIDDYTVGNAPAAEAKDGKNDVDARMERNATNADYKKMNEGAMEIYKGTLLEGRTRFAAQAEIAHLIEQKLSQLIKERSGEDIEPLRLPEAIDRAMEA